MIAIELFRQKVKDNEFDFLLDNVLLTKNAEHVPSADVEYIRAVLSSTFGIHLDTISVWIVGGLGQRGFCVD